MKKALIIILLSTLTQFSFAGVSCQDQWRAKEDTATNNAKIIDAYLDANLKLLQRSVYNDYIELFNFFLRNAMSAHTSIASASPKEPCQDLQDSNKEFWANIVIDKLKLAMMFPYDSNTHQTLIADAHKALKMALESPE